MCIRDRDTIHENFCLGESFSTEEIETAIDKAGLSDFVQAQPQGLQLSLIHILKPETNALKVAIIKTADPIKVKYLSAIIGWQKASPAYCPMQKKASSYGSGQNLSLIHILSVV